MNRAQTLRLSLLASLGLVGLACGGSTSATDGGGTPAGSGGATQAGGRNQGGNAGVSMGGTLNMKACTSPQSDPLTGLVTCKEGFQHRPRATACGVTLQKAAPAGGSSGIGAPEPQLPRAPGDVLCGDDPQNCDMYQYGYCDTVGGGAAPAVCRSGCITDEECGQGQLCLCGDSRSPTSGVCHYTDDCRTDADCESGFCAPYNLGCGNPRFACLQPNDECSSDADCGESDICTRLPPVDTAPDEGRACLLVACGRPFLVDAEARVAPVVRNAQWTEPNDARPRVEHLSEHERAAQAAHWTRLGQLEHASIAAFARFSLQLLSLGAPPELVEGCTRALADETAHAKLCFTLASAYAGRSIGPGRLDVSSSLEASSLADIVDLVLLEGCIGETKAALEALELADTATDPVIRAAYARIAADEERHAELAFRFIRWALTRSPATVRSRIEAALTSSTFDAPAANAVTRPCLEGLLAASRTERELALS